MSLFADLQARGLVEQISDPALGALVDAGGLVLYIGFDPTADSLHIGSLLQILGLVRMQRGGHTPIALVGGATGMVGDPSGKSEERKLLTREQIDTNCRGIESQLKRFLDFSSANAARMVNNADWFAGLGYLEFLRDIGKHFSLGAMLSKDSVKNRLEREQGISYTEFSYMLVQAYDYLHLYDAHSCRLQMGGSDQWGNITAGIELVRRMRQQVTYGLTGPLITTSDGKKFGKSEAGTIWLDAARSSPYQMFQYFLNTDDRDVGRFLKYFTFVPVAEIDERVAASAKDPGKREAARLLAREVVTMVHGAAEAQKAEAAAATVFGGQGASAIGETLVGLKTAEEFAASGIPGAVRERSYLPKLLTQILCDPDLKLCASNSAARRDIEAGAIYLNDVKVEDVTRSVTVEDVQKDRYLILRRGKKSQAVLVFFG
jgi:tyrosyl-tRNA synthetase